MLTNIELEMLIAAMYYAVDDFNDQLESGDDETRLADSVKLQEWIDHAVAAEVSSRHHLDQVIADARESLRFWREEVLSA